MNKKVLIGGLVALLVVGVGAYFLMSKSNKPATSTSNGIPDSKTMTNAIKKKSSLRDLLGMGKNLTCSYSDLEGNGAGVMYMSGEDIRTDFEMTLPEQGRMTSHMITDGEFVYIWSDGQTTGYKQAITDMDGDVDGDESETEDGDVVDFDQEVDVDCNNWKVDRSLFELPEGVEFSDFSEMMKDVVVESGSTGSTDTDPCSACEMLQGDTKTQCLQALGC